jgi:glycosyltransferase involved in cell wall biosynthesis
MKILMTARRFPPDVWSGTETVFENLYRRARERHEVRLVVGWRRARELVPPEARAVPLAGLDKARTWAAMAAATFDEARRWRPDVVLSNSIEVPPTGVPTATIVHDLNFGRAGGGLGAALRARFYGARARHLAAVVTVSAASARALQRIGVDAGRVHVIHNGVDLERFSPPPPGPLPDADAPVHFVHPSRILPGKGQHHAIDALARLRRDHKKRARLTIAGAPDDPVYLDQLRIQAYSLPVEFHVAVPDLAPYIQAADVVLFPTIMEEGFGFTAVEGMACGRPVIWADQPAIREATGGIGLAFPREDVLALRDHMAALMDDPARRRALGEEGRRHCERECDWDRVWARYEGVLAGIAR